MMDERTKFPVWITEYALTRGIIEAEAEDCFDISADMISVRSDYYPAHYHRNDWHRNEASAEARAEEMRASKIKSLEKQLAKLRKLVLSNAKTKRPPT